MIDSRIGFGWFFRVVHIALIKCSFKHARGLHLIGTKHYNTTPSLIVPSPSSQMHNFYITLVAVEA